MPRTFWLDPFDALESASRYWWVFIVSGIGWLFVSLIVFRFDWATVTAIGVLFGCIALVAGLLEFVAASASVGGWKILRYFLGVLFVVVGVLSFLTPGNTFVALAALVSFFFVFAGAFDIVNAIATRTVNSMWWLLLISGLIQVGLGFWAAGYWNRSVVLLVAWVGAATMLRGIAMLLLGFKLHELHRALATEPARQTTTQTTDSRRSRSPQTA
jgi:uncharacterized membrane protein HdeD (DUF308 family)